MWIDCLVCLLYDELYIVILFKVQQMYISNTELGTNQKNNKSGWFVTVASAQLMNINELSACTSESAGEVESPDIGVSAGGGEGRIGEFGVWEEREGVGH